MRWLGSHWTIDGLARHLHRKADAWVHMAQEGDGPRLTKEFVGHSLTKTVISFARYYVMMKAGERMHPRRLKILAIEFAEPETNTQLEIDWDQVVKLVDAILGEDILFSWVRMIEQPVQNTSAKRVTHQWVTFYDHNWKAIEPPDPEYVKVGVRWIEHEHYPYKATAGLDLIDQILEETNEGGTEVDGS